MLQDRAMFLEDLNMLMQDRYFKGIVGEIESNFGVLN